MTIYGRYATSCFSHTLNRDAVQIVRALPSMYSDRARVRIALLEKREAR